MPTPERELLAKELTVEEGKVLFDQAARRLLGVSGDQFLAQWEAGVYRGHEGDPSTMYLVMLLPFAR